VFRQLPRNHHCEPKCDDYLNICPGNNQPVTLYQYSHQQYYLFNRRWRNRSRCCCLPTGVNGVYATGVFTISGTPSVTGTFNYTVTTTGTCVQATATGTITVNPNATITLTSGAGTNVKHDVSIRLSPISLIQLVEAEQAAGVVGLPNRCERCFMLQVYHYKRNPICHRYIQLHSDNHRNLCSGDSHRNITVNPNATITLTSAPATTNQSLCINTAINNITYSIGGGGTGAGVVGLPTGVNGVYAAGVFTISGTPTVSGTFNYTVTNNRNLVFRLRLQVLSRLPECNDYVNFCSGNN